MSVMSNIVGIDIGNDKCVVAIVKQKAIQILMNHDAKYEIPSVVSFTKKKRQIGTEKASLAMMNPENTITQVKRLIGQNFDEPGMAEELKLFPFKTSKADDGGILIHINYLGEERTFTPVQILAMLLCHLKQMIERSDVDWPVSDFVISVPSYFNDLQRAAYLNAAEIAGLNLLRLMNDGTAIALGYGYFKRDLDYPINVVFVDVGHSDTQVTVAQFDREGVTILSHAFDRNLGGRDFDRVLYNHFLKDFSTRCTIDIESNPRATVRLMSACEKVKKVLTANREANISVDCLVNGVGVDGSIQRDDFDEMSTDLLKRLRTTLETALTGVADTKLKNGQINSVELVGSGSRIPAISRVVRDIFGMEPSRTLNGSDCVARGCAFQCSMLSGSRASKDYKVQDSLPFSVGFTWRLRSDETSEDDNNQNTKISKTGSCKGRSVSSKSRSKETELSINDEDVNSVSKPSGGNQMSSLLLFNKGQHIPTTIFAEFPEVSKQFQFSSLYLYKGDSRPNASQKSRTFKVDDTKMVSNKFIPVRVEISIDLHGMVVIADDSQPNPVGKVNRKQEITREEFRCYEILPIGMSKHSLAEAQESERAFLLHDIEVDEVQRQKNDLEAFIYSTRKELNGRYEEFAKKSEKERIFKNLDALETWLSENDDHEEESGIYSNELDALRELVSPIESRYKFFIDCMDAKEELHVSYAELNKVLASMKLVGYYYNHYHDWLEAAIKLLALLPKDIEQLPVLLKKIKTITILVMEERCHLNESRKMEDSQEIMVRYASSFKEANKHSLFEYYKGEGKKKGRWSFIGAICNMLSDLLKTIAPNLIGEDKLSHGTMESLLQVKDHDIIVDKQDTSSSVMQNKRTAEESSNVAGEAPSRAKKNSKHIDFKSEPDASSSELKREEQDRKTERTAKEKELINSMISDIQLQLCKRYGDLISQLEKDETDKKLDDIKNCLLEFGDDELYDMVEQKNYELRKHLAALEDRCMKEEIIGQQRARLLYMIFDSRVKIMCIAISMSHMTRREEFDNLVQNVTNFCNNLEKDLEEMKSHDTLLPCEMQDLKRLQQYIQHFADSLMEETKSEAAVLEERISDIEKKVFGRYRYIARSNEKKKISKIIKEIRDLLRRSKASSTSSLNCSVKEVELKQVISTLEGRYQKQKDLRVEAEEELCDCIYDHSRTAKFNTISFSDASLVKQQCDDDLKWLRKNHLKQNVTTGDIKKRKESLNMYCENIKRGDSRIVLRETDDAINQPNGIFPKLAKLGKALHLSSRRFDAHS